MLLSTDKPEPWPSLISPGIIDNLVTTITLPLGSVIGSLLVFLPRILGLTNDLLGNPVIKEGVHQFYKFVLKCKVRYTDTAVICDFPQIC